MIKKNFSEELRKRSLLLVEPKESFFEWVRSVEKYDPLRRSAGKIYPSNSCGAWLAKGSSSFKAWDDFQAYVSKWKADFVRVEVTSVFPGVGRFPEEASAESFDRYFSLRVIEPVVEVEEIDK